MPFLANQSLFRERTDPENVVEKKTSKEKCSNSYTIERDHLDGIQRERQTKHIVGEPVLWRSHDIT